MTGLFSLSTCWLGFAALDQVFPLATVGLLRPASVRVLDNENIPLGVFLAADDRWRLPVRIEQVGETMRRVVVESEDGWFYRHPGFNPLAVIRAAWSNWRAGRVVSGASTIPMQIARLCDPRPRTLLRKIVELFRAIQLDQAFSKDELLEIYLNLAPYGGNVEGLGAASLFYFGKDPRRLSLAEATMLTVIPRAPAAYDPTRHPDVARAVRDRLLRQLGQRGLFSRPQIEGALREPVPRVRYRPRLVAPHVATELGLAATQEDVRTTIDRKIQRAANDLVSKRIRPLRLAGIEQAAVVVIEMESRAVRALVGSADFFDDSRQGQVDGTRARRSPGSTLKPFLYAMAFDLGHIVPDSYILDVPTSFAGYVAENYDERYRGRVTARTALARSLNAPAIRLLADVGLERFHKLLLRGGLSTLDRQPSHYGLPLILGSGEVSLLSLTNLYATLADGGHHLPYRFTPGPSRPGARIFSAEASQLVTNILLDVRRPDLPRSWNLTRDAPAVAWKTGTSYGHRDAWAVGYAGRYAIGVWVGNFDGSSRQGISGAEHAAPLLFDLFRAIEPHGSEPNIWQHLESAETDVCVASHQRPGPSCTDRMKVSYIPDTTRLAPCSYHRTILVDNDTGEELSGDCLMGRAYHQETVTVFPRQLIDWWRSTGQAVPAMPPRNPSCREIDTRGGPRIVSPGSRAVYRLRRGTPKRFQQIRLSAQSSAEIQELHWFHDGVHIGAARVEDDRHLPLSQGQHRLVVVDDLGRTDAVTYTVE